MAKQNKVPWVMMLLVGIGVGTVCWGLMYPIDLVLEWKEKMDVRAYLPRAGLPFAVACVALFGVALLYMMAKGFVKESAVEKILTLMMAAFVGYGALEFFTAEIRCVQVINPPASHNKTNTVALANNHEWTRIDTNGDRHK